MTHSLAESLDGRSPDRWALDFLAMAGFPPTPENVRAVVSWEYAESSGGGGMYNPLNTTQGGYFGETDFNSVGVKNYRQYNDGLAANARVIHNGYYPDVVANFRLGEDARRTCDAITRSPWGTGFIHLVGEQPTPVPQPEVEMQQIPTGQKPKLPGRVPAARWSSDAPNEVTFTNGATVLYNGIRYGGGKPWTPPVTKGAHGVGIMPTVDRHNKPDGKGITLQDSADGTFTATLD